MENKKYLTILMETKIYIFCVSGWLAACVWWCDGVYVCCMSVIRACGQRAAHPYECIEYAVVDVDVMPLDAFNQ